MGSKPHAALPPSASQTARRHTLIETRGSLAKRFPTLSCEWCYDKNHPHSPDSVSPFSNYKVWWQCRASGHVYQSVIAARARGSGCPYCSGRLVDPAGSLATRCPKLMREWDGSRNSRLDPTRIAPGSDKRVWWKCANCGHSWCSRIANRTGPNKSGCPACAEKLRSESKTGRGLARSGSLLEMCPAIATQWHLQRNAPLTPDRVSPNSGKSVWWKCSRGHEWKVRVISRTSRGGTGCPFCSNQTSRLELRLLCELRAVFDRVLWRQKINKREVDLCIPSRRLAIEVDGYPWHKDREARDLAKQHSAPEWAWIRVRDSRLPLINKEDVQFRDKEAHLLVVCRVMKRIAEAVALPEEELSRVCEYLESESLLAEDAYSAAVAALPGPPQGCSLGDQHPELVSEWHPSKNGVLTPDLVHPASSLKLWWQCRAGHEWQSVISNRAFGRGCPDCNRRETGRRTRKRVLNDVGSLLETHPHLALEWDNERNAQSPSDYSSGSSVKVWWQCVHGHSWKATVASRARKATKCPFCIHGGIRMSEAFWNGRLQELVAFIELNKRLPRRSRKDRKERSLAEWVRTQRDAKASGKLKASRLRLLTSAGICWRDRGQPT